jgi:cytoskeletal protein CcmA (bactofilin family)
VFKESELMAKPTRGERDSGGPVISIIGPGMQVTGDCVAEGTIRVEGEVRGTIYAAKAVVVGKDGVVKGDIATHDAVISGKVGGSVIAASRLEVQATAKVDGTIRTPRMQLEEGAIMNAEVAMGEVSLEAPPSGRGSGRGAGSPEKGGESRGKTKEDEAASDAREGAPASR